LKSGIVKVKSIHPSFIEAKRANIAYKQSKQFKNTYNIGFDAKVHLRLFNRLHVAHKNDTKIEMIYNHITPKYTYTQTCETIRKFSIIKINLRIVINAFQVKNC